MPLTDEKMKAWHSVHKAYSSEVAAALPKKKKVRVVFPPKEEEVAEPKAGSLEYFQKQKEKFKGTKYEADVDEEIDRLNKKSMTKEVKQNMKDPIKVKKLIDIFETSKKEYDGKEREITAMMTKVKAPTGTKKEIIDMIESLVPNALDRYKLKLDKRDKGTLQTIYMETSARHDWYKKNKPGQGVDYDLDD